MTGSEPAAATDFQAAMQGYLGRSGQKLVLAGFEVRYGPVPFLMTAHRSSVELSSFADVDRVFVFAHLVSPTIPMVEQFSHDVFTWARHWKSSRLRGLFEPTHSVAVAIVETAPPDLVASVTSHDGPKHLGGIESRVVVDLSRNSLIMFEGSPIIGAFPRRTNRRVVREMLG